MKRILLDLIGNNVEAVRVFERRLKFEDYGIHQDNTLKVGLFSVNHYFKVYWINGCRNERDIKHSLDHNHEGRFRLYMFQHFQS